MYPSTSLVRNPRLSLRVTTMGNNVSCQTVGVGNVRIKMYDDMIRTFPDVRPVAKFKSNLIPLGVFESEGSKFTSEGGVLRISEGMLVVMKEDKTGNLYGLKGSTQINETTHCCRDYKTIQNFGLHPNFRAFLDFSFDGCKHSSSPHELL